MHANVYLRITNDYSPRENKHPPLAEALKCLKDKHTQAEMRGSMRGSEARTLGTILSADYNFLCHHWVATRPKSKNSFLDELAADQIADCCREDKSQRPPPSFNAEIKRGVNEQEQIKRQPELRFAKKGKNKIQ